MSFVTCKLYAQCGNMMFQISATIAHALKHGVEYKIPAQGHSPELPSMPFPHLPIWTPADGLGAPYVEQQEQFGLHHEMPYWPKMRLQGYFQNEKYFKDYRKEILEAFLIPYEAMDDVSIHVRRTDYLLHPTKHPVVTMEYIEKAIETITDKTGLTQFKVFSDDIQWCIESFKERFGNPAMDHFTFVDRNPDPLANLALMSSCSHQIIANSTYSWWAGYLNRNPNKVIVCPKVWFGPGNSALSSSEICPPSWIRV